MRRKPKGGLTGRGSQLVRVLREVHDIASSRHATVNRLAQEHGVSQKTIRRDLLLIEEAGFPLIEEKGWLQPTIYRMEPDWLRRVLEKGRNS